MIITLLRTTGTYVLVSPLEYYILYLYRSGTLQIHEHKQTNIIVFLALSNKSKSNLLLLAK